MKPRNLSDTRQFRESSSGLAQVRLAFCRALTGHTRERPIQPSLPTHGGDPASRLFSAAERGLRTSAKQS